MIHQNGYKDKRKWRQFLDNKWRSYLLLNKRSFSKYCCIHVRSFFWCAWAGIKAMQELAYLMAAFTSSYDALLSSRHVKSTTETFGVGTRKAIPVSFPLSSGSTFPTAYHSRQKRKSYRLFKEIGIAWEKLDLVPWLPQSN